MFSQEKFYSTWGKIEAVHPESQADTMGLECAFLVKYQELPELEQWQS